MRPGSVAHDLGAWLSRGIGSLLVLGIGAYQMLLSPLIGPSCRFAPSCSAYTMQAIRVHGPVRGSWLGTRRILRCHPFTMGGFDPVPERSVSASGSAPASAAGSATHSAIQMGGGR